MKYWLSHLPLEVWVDCYRYPWISREEMGRIVDRFSNCKYVEYLQFYLYDWGKQKLNELYFDKDGLYKYVDYSTFDRLYMDFPLTPMPGNIKSFDYISISHFDTQAIAFLRQIGPILTNVNLDLYDVSHKNMENFRIVFANLLPLLNRIGSLSFDVRELANVKQTFGAENLTKLNVMEIYGYHIGLDEATQQATIDFLLNWFTSSTAGQDCNGPKFCRTSLHNAFIDKITAAIRQDFLAAKTPRTFALIFPYHSSQFAEFHLQNNIEEELYGIRIGNAEVQISRDRENCGTELGEWIEDCNSKINDCQSRINIQSPTIGLLDAIDAPENVDENLQPSTSKKARIS